MHPALQLPEILFEIFGHCRRPRTGMRSRYHNFKFAPGLPALARTCRVFKEPALDLLWEDLPDPTPLAQCFPETTCCIKVVDFEGKHYSFTRWLRPVEWVILILYNYTHRIRSLTVSRRNFDWESFKRFSNPLTEPLFPNLRHLLASGEATHIQRTLSFPHPSLTSLTLRPKYISLNEDLHALQSSFESLHKFSPNIERLTMMHCYGSGPLTLSKYFSLLVSRLYNLQCVDCFGITLDVNALSHLSRTSTLTQLAFTLSSPLVEQIVSSDLLLAFPSLRVLSLDTTSLGTVLQLVSRMQLYTIAELLAFVEEYISKQDLSVFFAGLQASCISRMVLRLKSYHTHRSSSLHRFPPPVLCFEDLQPCMAFSSLHTLEIDLKWEVRSTSNELLTLASAWPRLKYLAINPERCWKTRDGITPDGLLQLLQAHPPLAGISVNIDTRDYTECRPFPDSLRSRSPRSLDIDLNDSHLGEDSVPAISAFLVNIASHFRLRFPRIFRYGPDSSHSERWENAIALAEKVHSGRS